MKKQILAYITALINNEIRNIERFKLLDDEDVAVAVLENSKNRLIDLESFVADLKEIEVKESDEIETLNYQIFNFKKDNESWNELYKTLSVENVRLNETLGQAERDLRIMEQEKNRLLKEKIQLKKDLETATGIPWR